MTSSRRSASARRPIDFLPRGAGADVAVYVFGPVSPAAAFDFLLRGKRVTHKGPALLRERGMRFQRLDHPRVRRLARGFRERRDALLQSLGELERGGRGHENSLE